MVSPETTQGCYQVWNVIKSCGTRRYVDVPIVPSPVGDILRRSRQMLLHVPYLFVHLQVPLQFAVSIQCITTTTLMNGAFQPPAIVSDVNIHHISQYRNISICDLLIAILASGIFQGRALDDMRWHQVDILCLEIA